MDWKFLFFSLSGRIHRMHWWIGMLTVELVGLGLAMLGFWLVGSDPEFYWNDTLPTHETALVEAVVFVITLRASLAVDMKRIHDVGRTAYLLMPFYLGNLAFIFMDASGTNPLYFPLGETELIGGYPYMLLARICLIIAFALYAIWFIFLLGFHKGTGATSKYGPDPLAKSV
jgi:uncharacterized membrane protein YhaH (DUF805 family)